MMRLLESRAQVSQRTTDGIERRPCPDDGSAGTALGGDRHLFYVSMDGQDVLVGCAGDRFYATVTVSAVDADDPIPALDYLCGAMKAVDAADRSGGGSHITIAPVAIGGGGIITRC